MAYPEKSNPKPGPFDDANRDPTGTDPRSHQNYWMQILGVAVVALIGFFLINSMYDAPTPVSNSTTSSQRVEPNTIPDPVQPKPQ